MGASAILKSVDIRAFAVNVKTIAPTQKLYQSGHAIWWGEEPRIIDTFLESYEFSGKTIIPFCTSGGSGISTAVSHIKDIASGSPEVKEGHRFSGDVSKATIEEWIEGLSLGN